METIALEAAVWLRRSVPFSDRSVAGLGISLLLLASLALPTQHVLAQDPAQPGGEPPPAAATTPEPVAPEPVAPELVAPEPPIAVLADDEVSATGRQSTTFTISRFGRWSVATSSERGVALQLVDKVSGPGPVFGAPGETDGRVDLFLDRGTYRILTRGPEVGEGVARAALAVRPFVERSRTAVRLPDLADLETELGDFEQVSWWVQIESRRRLTLEAAGRHLEDLRIWREGTWMEGFGPQITTVEPEIGKPLTLCRLTAELDPGVYQLTAYGGQGLPWADDDGSRPLLVRSGVERRAEAGRSRLEISKFGFDRFLVPVSASFLRLEVPDGDLLTGLEATGTGHEGVVFDVAGWDEDDPFDERSSLRRSVITKDLRELAVEQTHGSRQGDGLRLVVVRGLAGQPYVLQHFDSRTWHRFQRSGWYWIDTVHSGHPADTVEATGLLFDNFARTAAPLAKDVVALHEGIAIRRRFNLIEGEASLFLEVLHLGSYEILAGESAAPGDRSAIEVDVRLEPYWMPGFQPEERPPWREGGDRWELDRGYYVLTLRPEEQGIVDLSIRDASNAPLPQRSSANPAPRATARLGRVFLDRTKHYGLHLNQQPGVVGGIVLRNSPVDVSESLPFVATHLAEDWTHLRLEITTPGPGFVEARAENGELFEVSLDDGEYVTSLPVEKGSGVLRVRATQGMELPLAGSVRWIPRHRRGPLPELPAGTLEELPELPTLTAAVDRHIELDRDERATFLVTAETAALYRLESTGLLDTVGVLRTRVQPEVERSDDEGTGRNFLIQHWLGAGDYQLTLWPLGRSRGATGVRLADAPVGDGGALRPGVAARGWIDSGASLRYTFDVEEEGRWRIWVPGLGGPFRVRLEDADGWPVLTPGEPGDFVTRLDPGRYHLVVLPRAVRSRHVALVEPVPEPQERDGHGPFDLPLALPQSHEWFDPSAKPGSGAWEPAPDRWRFGLEAEVDLKIELGDQMAGTLVRLDEEESEGDASGQVVAEVVPRRGWDGPVVAGRYELRVTPARPNNRVPYTVRVSTEQLVPGDRRKVHAPRTYEVRVGEPALVAFESLATFDLRATLLDESGREIARADDRPGDWNVRLVRRLAPGTYKLVLATDGSDAGELDLRLPRLVETEGSEVDLTRGDAAAELVPGDEVHLLPLTLPAERADGLLAVAGASAEALRLTLEARSGEGWVPVADAEGAEPYLSYVLAADEALRLRVESLDQGGSTARLALAARTLTGAASARVADEARAARGVDAAPTVGGRGALAVRLDRPGCFDLEVTGIGSEGPRAAGFAGRSLRATPDLAAAERVLWLEGPARARMTATRWQWSADEVRRLRLRGDETATCDLQNAGAAHLLAARGLGATPSLSAGPAARGAQAAQGDEVLALASAEVDAARVGLPGAGAAGGLGWAEVELRAWTYPGLGTPDAAGTGSASTIDYGSFDGALGVSDGPVFGAMLPGEGQPVRLRLRLDRGVAAAVLGPRGDVHFLHRPADHGAAIRTVTEGGRLWLLAAPDPDRAAGTTDEGRSLRYAVDVLPAGDLGGPALGRPLELRVGQAGLLDLPLPSFGSPTRLQVRGAELVTLLAADGSVVRGTDLRVPAGGGRMQIEHGVGTVLAWLGEDDGDLWSEQSVPGSVAETVPLEVPAVVRLDGGGAFGLTLEEGRVVHLRAPTQALLSVTREVDGAREEPDVSIHPDALSADVYLPSGPAIVRLRGLGGEPLAGELEVTSSEVAELAEGLGPEVLLGPGDERFFTLRVERSGPIGLGVRADSEIVGLRLLGASGASDRSAGAGGVLQMPDLEPGTYLVVLSLPADASPVRARPVVVGLEPPSQGPPPDVARRYLAEAGGTQ